MKSSESSTSFSTCDVTGSYTCDITGARIPDSRDMDQSFSKYWEPNLEMPLPPEKTALTPDAVVCILEACARTGVSSICFANLKVTFREQTKHAKPQEHITQPEAEISDHQNLKTQERYLNEEEAQTREDQIAELFITNPQLAEQMIQNGELSQDDGPGFGGEDESP